VSTLEDIFKQGQNQLSRFSHPDLDAKILLCESVSISIEQFHVSPGKLVTKNQANHFFRLIKKRQQGFPLAYLTGKKEFWTLEFTVDSSVLIPRPETELIVEKAVELSSKSGTAADIGTGCGNIAISLAKEFPEMRIVAIDVSKKALKTARSNACLHGLDRIEFYQGNMFAPLKELKLESRCDIIVSNPPYVSEEEWKDLQPEITQHEPKKALVSGQSGLERIKELINRAPIYLRSGGFLIFEFGAGQKEKILELFRYDWIDVCCFNDLYGIPRVMVAQKK
jgi:release factor glutamine methyltransferase